MRQLLRWMQAISKQPRQGIKVLLRTVLLRCSRLHWQMFIKLEVVNNGTKLPETRVDRLYILWTRYMTMYTLIMQKRQHGSKCEYCMVTPKWYRYSSTIWVQVPTLIGYNLHYCCCWRRWCRWCDVDITITLTVYFDVRSTLHKVSSSNGSSSLATHVPDVLVLLLQLPLVSSLFHVASSSCRLNHLSPGTSRLQRTLKTHLECAENWKWKDLGDNEANSVVWYRRAVWTVDYLLDDIALVDEVEDVRCMEQNAYSAGDDDR